MRNLVIILDPAHGSDVKGKQSPDGTHREYIWSRSICKELKPKLEKLGFRVEFTNTSDLEIGLSKRKNIADNIEASNKEVKFLLSLHNNAAGDGSKFMLASGVEIWTSKGKTNSDIFADIIFQTLINNFDDVKPRRHSKDQTSKEENFTVLTGRHYYACLLEWLFQDNEDDLIKLKSPVINGKLVDSLVESMLKIDEFIHNKLNK